MSSPASFPLPNDLSACQALIEQLAMTVEEQSQQIRSLKEEREEQELKITELLRLAFLKRRERYLADPKQLKLDFPDLPGIDDVVEGLAEAVEEHEQTIPEHQRRRPKRKPRNENLPPHLPRYEILAPVPDDVKYCLAHGERTLIGYDLVETLEFERPKRFSATFGGVGFSTQDVGVVKIGVLRRDLTQLGGNDERNPSIECVDHGLELAGV